MLTRSICMDALYFLFLSRSFLSLSNVDARRFESHLTELKTLFMDLFYASPNNSTHNIPI